jgi:dTMP kinase
MSKPRGALVVLEGLDRSGKSTQCERLVSQLRHNGKQVEHLRFPNRTTPIGQMINSYLSGATQTEDHVIHLLFSANRWESAAEIERLINDGVSVVIDRYYYSGCVYTAAKQIPAMDLAWCRQPEVGLPRPDICLFLDVSAEAAMSRGGYGAERYEKKEMQDRVRELFGELRTHADEGEDVVVVNADQSVDEVAKEILNVVESVMDKLQADGGSLRNVKAW